MVKRLDLPQTEEEIQDYWDKNSIYTEVIESRRGGKKFYFCQGPPFTSGHAHIGHAWNHTIKDAYLRFKTQLGYDVFRRAGWDTHGLPIEVKVEETVLGSRSKKEIEEFGIDNFIRECKKFAIQNMNKMTSQLVRLGVWLDWEDPYMTLDREYMEGVWFVIKKAHEKDLLYEAEQVIHWCPRCETALAGYEVKDEYRDVTDISAYVKAKIKGKNEYILIWTTTPWTLPANTGIAVHPDFDYVKAEIDGETIIFAKDRMPAVCKDSKCNVIKEVKGKDLEGLEYEPILDVPIQKSVKRRVVMAPDLVNLEDGSGCVHLAPGHGEEDFKVGSREGLSILSPVDDAGRFTIEPYSGTYIRDANRPILGSLESSGRLYREEKIVHSYPHCWRCKTPLMLRITMQWFLAVSKIKEDLLKRNKEIEWVPDWIGSGRFENWLTNAKDWCISRQRYWNTPLPVWKCECGKMKVIGSIDELADAATEKIDLESLDLHRPTIDKIKLRCTCSKEMHRVKDVMDVWLDSGSASWANLRYPSRKDLFESLYPVDFITEGSDQTRGWFYSMLVCSSIAFDKTAYKKVLYHGFTLDSEGRKMSKSLGNIVDPVDIISKYGADVLRYYLLWTASLWEDLRFSWDGVETVNRLLNIIWNSHSFARTYMEIDGFDPKKTYETSPEEIDLWILSKYNSMVRDTTDAFEQLRLNDACRHIHEFTLELSRWYIKLIRDRVWIEKDDPRKLAAYTTLQHVLEGLARVMAPITPHFSETVYRELTGARSVHLLDWPVFDENKIDPELEESMKLAQEITECVAAARQKAKIKLRWPIARVIVAPKDSLDLSRVKGLILKACNSKSLEVEAIETEVTMKINFAVLGPKAKGDIKNIVNLLENQNPAKVKSEMEQTGEYPLRGFTLKPEDIIFESSMPEDIIAEEFSDGIVYIDSKLDDDLYSEAMSREVIRRIQEMRKQLSLDELAQVRTGISTDNELTKYIQENQRIIEQETRSMITFEQIEGHINNWKIEGHEIEICIRE